MSPALLRCQDILKKLDDSSRTLGNQKAFQSARSEAVVEISQLGVPRSAVAKLTGLTRGRVQQILDAAGATGATGDEWKDPEVKALVEKAILDRPLPSIGLGLRRETPGASHHLGRGYGGQFRITGDVDSDRDEIVEALTLLLDQAKKGKFDELLVLTEEERELLEEQAQTGSRP